MLVATIPFLAAFIEFTVGAAEAVVVAGGFFQALLVMQTVYVAGIIVPIG
jgi:hypothetical protein